MKHLRWSLSDEVFQRSGEMGLIEIASLMRGGESVDVAKEAGAELVCSTSLKAALEPRSSNQAIFLHNAQHNPAASMTALTVLMGLLHLTEGKRLPGRYLEMTLIDQPCQRL
jgi:hypothetical protein